MKSYGGQIPETTCSQRTPKTPEGERNYSGSLSLCMTIMINENGCGIGVGVMQSLCSRLPQHDCVPFDELAKSQTGMYVPVWGFLWNLHRFQTIVLLAHCRVVPALE